jgi:pimeloyl-ACP methyl ester carboxylesterase
MKPLGGMRFWADTRFFRGWRIQQNVVTGQFRLLDPRDGRYASGTLQTCLNKLTEITESRKLAPMSGRVVIAVHGILRSSRTFALMRPALEQAGYTVVNFDYPSTRIDIAQAALHLGQVIESLEGIDQINFVVHSMGGLVTRAYLKEHADGRIRRLVMLGVPNHGAEMADLLRRNYAFRLVFGPAGQQLVTHEAGLIRSLPIPDLEFAIIAGGRGGASGFNPLIRGDNDLLVSVESARLPGAADSITFRSFHRLLPANAEAIDATVRFLETGSLRIDGSRQPIPREAGQARQAR